MQNSQENISKLNLTTHKKDYNICKMKYIWVFRNIIWKNENELFDQRNITQP